MSQSIVAETAERLFTDLADPLEINRAKDASWKAPLWRALEESGLPLAWVSEAQGGAGVSMAEGFEIVQAAGRVALALPLVETMLAGWLLGKAGIASPAGMMTLAPARPKDRIALNADGTLSGEARGVPFASEAAHIAILAEGANGVSIALVDAKACRVVAGESLGRDPRDTVVLDKVKPLKIAAAPAGFDKTGLLLMAITARSLQISGALQSALDISVRYSTERVAFEKPISKFQAIQHSLARLAGETAAAVAAAGSAADTIASEGAGADAVALEAISAKIRCAEAAEQGAAIAHQVHGAIGFTQEYVLHRFTLRALGWRDDFGNESEWAVTLGNRIAAGGADELWPLVASR